MPSGIPREPEPREWVLTKVCVLCGERKPWAKFAPKRYYEDGSVRTIQSACTACKVKAHAPVKRAWVERNREHVNAGKRAWRRERARKLRAERSPHGGTMIPAAPFVAWAREEAAVLGGLEAFAECTGLSPRGVGRLLREEQNHVSLWTVDKCCVALGVHPRDIYGDLYDEERAA